MHSIFQSVTKVLFILCIALSSPMFASEYTVKAGDTLLNIARQNVLTTTKEDQQALNKFVDQVIADNPAQFPDGDADRLSPGMKLKIPDSKPSIIPQTEPETAKQDIIPLTNTNFRSEAVGHISRLDGQGWLLHTDETKQKLYTGLDVKQGDNIVTNLHSMAEVEFPDGSSILLKQNSQIKVNEYSWDQETTSGSSVLGFLKGAFRAVSGLIAKNNPDDYSVETPVATIGVRGTIFGAKLCNQETCVEQNGENSITISEGIYIGVLQGKIVAQSGEQETLVNAGETIYQKNISSKAVKVASLPGLIFSAEELKQFMPSKKKSRDTQSRKASPKKKVPYYGAFWLDANGQVIKDSQGNCVRNGSYRNNHNVAECE